MQNGGERNQKENSMSCSRRCTLRGACAPIEPLSKDYGGTTGGQDARAAAA